MPGLLTALVGQWAMESASLDTLQDQADLIAQGPIDRTISAINGDRVLEPQITGSRAVVRVDGVLMAGVPWWMYYMGIAATDLGELAQVLDELATDHGRITEVILAINSPGGTVGGTNEAAAAVRRLRAAGVRVVAQCQGMCCSAAYWIAAQCDEIVATPTTIMGSIGVYSLLMDDSRRQDAEGRQLIRVASGPEKGLGADGKVSPELIAQTQRRVDAIHVLFVGAVALGRGITPEAAQENATGDHWLAADALTRGLIDGISDELATYPNPTDDEDAAAAAAAGTPTPSAQTNPPAATSAAQPQESMMTPEEMTALIKAHPEHATLIADNFSEKKTEADCLRAIASAEKAQRIEAQEATAKATKGQQWEQATGSVPDPGSDHSAEGRAANPLSDEGLKASWNAMTPDQQAGYMTFESYSWLAKNGKLPKEKAKA